MKKIISALLATVLVASLACTPALAADTLLFPKTVTYQGFADVPADHWAFKSIALCYETGLMQGTTATLFSPQETITEGSITVLAARIHAALNNTTIPKTAATTWYGDAQAYLKAATGIEVYSPTSVASRAVFATMLASVLPETALPPLNTVTALPDTSAPEILALYNGGILQGMDKAGTFSMWEPLTRDAAAAMVARIIDPAQRLTFTLAPDQATYDPTVLTIAGSKIGYNAFWGWLSKAWNTLRMSQQIDASQINSTVEQYLKNTAINNCAIDFYLSQQAKTLGCANSEVAAKLFPAPTSTTLQNFSTNNGYLRAKHILISTIDQTTGQPLTDAALAAAKATADDLVAQLTASSQPTSLFETLLATHGTDPGMTANPHGYLFQEGTMVEEFYNGTLSLQVGAYSPAPVQSSFGYHIILRLDPATHPDMAATYQNRCLSEAYSSWLSSTPIEINQDFIAAINLPYLLG